MRNFQTLDILQILSNIDKHIKLPQPEKEHFLSLLISRKLKRKQFLLHENEVCQYSAFVLDGCLRGYTVDQQGFEHVLQFAPENWWIADMYSLLSQKPGQLNIDALEDTEVLLLPKSEQEKLYLENPKFERFFRIITENSLVSNRQRVIDGLSLSAEERYHGFCKRYPSLIERLPQKQVASYIGVTPEFLSKLKADWVKNNRIS